ncbi:MAG: hypothetical protein L7F78_12670 [Syntrophales bacterium LBB04]|nr:hypothetical protein [Syntrophales bacterium LBB04]
MALLYFLELFGINHVCHGAAGIGIWKQLFIIALFLAARFFITVGEFHTSCSQTRPYGAGLPYQLFETEFSEKFGRIDQHKYLFHLAAVLP